MSNYQEDHDLTIYSHLVITATDTFDEMGLMEANQLKRLEPRNLAKTEKVVKELFDTSWGNAKKIMGELRWAKHARTLNKRQRQALACFPSYCVSWEHLRRVGVRKRALKVLVEAGYVELEGDSIYRKRADRCRQLLMNKSAAA